MTPLLMNWKSYAIVSGAGLLATWLGLSPSPPAGFAPAAAAPRGTRDAGIDIEAQAARLQTRVRGELDYRDPSRNPFRFGTHPPTVAAVPHGVTVPSTIPTIPAPESEPFAYVVSGMAVDTVDGEITRTAIVSTPSDVLFLKQGDHVATYTVTGIDENGIELTAADGTVRRLTLIP